jgi:hypothetical protein
LLLTGCSNDESTSSKESSQFLTEYNVYSYDNASKETKVLSIYNSVGDISLSNSKSNNISISAKIIQTKNISDLDFKKSKLVLNPTNYKEILYLEPLLKNTSDNYWQKISNANGIKLNFNIQIPNTIQEVRMFTEIGNINLKDIKTKIYAQTDIGDITAENISPVDDAVFKANVSSGVKLSFLSLKDTNKVTTGLTIGSLELLIPNAVKYNHNIDKEMKTEYPYDMYSDRRIKYIREKCRAEYKPSLRTKSETTITTMENNNAMRNTVIKSGT